MARLLYPHDALSNAVFAEVRQPLQHRAANDPTLAAALRGGLAQLDQVAGRDGRTAPAEDQISSLEQIADGVFFTTMQDAVRMQLYERPEVWRLIGYGALRSSTAATCIADSAISPGSRRPDDGETIRSDR